MGEYLSALEGGVAVGSRRGKEGASDDMHRVYRTMCCISPSNSPVCLELLDRQEIIKILEKFDPGLMARDAGRSDLVR